MVEVCCPCGVGTLFFGIVCLVVSAWNFGEVRPAGLSVERDVLAHFQAMGFCANLRCTIV